MALNRIGQINCKLNLFKLHLKLNYVRFVGQVVYVVYLHALLPSHCQLLADLLQRILGPSDLGQGGHQGLVVAVRVGGEAAVHSELWSTSFLFCEKGRVKEKKLCRLMKYTSSLKFTL